MSATPLPSSRFIVRLVSFDKADFVGRRALAAEVAAGGPARRLAGLQLAWYDIEGPYKDQSLHDVGVYHRGVDTWLVLATAPVAPDAPQAPMLARRGVVEEAMSLL